MNRILPIAIVIALAVAPLHLVAQEKQLGEQKSGDTVGAPSTPPNIVNSPRGGSGTRDHRGHFDREDPTPPDVKPDPVSDPKIANSETLPPERDPASFKNAIQIRRMVESLERIFGKEGPPTKAEVDQAWKDLQEKGMEGLTERQRRIIDPPAEAVPFP